MANQFDIDTNDDTHLLNETFHIFSKSPASNTTTLGGAKMKSGHTTTTADVWSQEIPAFFNAPTSATFAKYQSVASNEDLCLYNGKVWQHNGTTFEPLGTTAEVLTDGKTFSKNGKEVIKYHKGRTAINLTSDNNNGDGANNLSAKIYNAATGSTTFVSQFISSTDKFTQGIPSDGYNAVVTGDGQPMVEGLTNDDDYICNAYAGVIQFNRVREQGSVVVSAWEYIGTKLDTTVSSIVNRVTEVETQLGGGSGTGGGSVIERLATAESEIDTLQSEMDAVEGRIDTAEGEIDALQTAVTTTLPESIAAAKSAADTAQAEVDALETRVTTAEGDITTLEGKVAALESGKLRYQVVHSVDVDNKTYVETEGAAAQDCVVNVIYLVSDDTVGAYVEYLCVANSAGAKIVEQIGTTDADLDGYATWYKNGEATTYAKDSGTGNLVKATVTSGVTNAVTEVAIDDNALDTRLGEMVTATATAQTTANQGVADAATAQAAADAAQDDVDALKELVGELPEGATATTIVDYVDATLAEAKTYADQAETDAIASAKSYTDTAITDVREDITTLSGSAITTINGDTTSSELVKVAAAEATGDPTTVNLTVTVKNVAKASDLTALTDRVTTAEGKIDILNGGATVEGSVAKALADANAYADAAEADAITAAATDATTKANQALADAKAYADQAEADAITAAATTAQNKADAAQAAAISAAATDATTKADAAEAAAKAYTDGQIAALTADGGAITALAGRVTTAEGEIDALQTAVTTLQGADTDLSERITANEDKLDGITGTVTDAIATAKSEAITAAAEDATTKADQAEADAIAAAATDATTKANTAKSEAIAAAAEDATTKANAAQAAAIAAAATDATSKANAAQTAAEATAAADATTKANKALTDAKAHTDAIADSATYTGAAQETGTGTTSTPTITVGIDLDGSDKVSITAEDIASKAALDYLRTKVNSHIADAAKLGIVVANASTDTDRHPAVENPSTNKIYLVKATDDSPEAGTYAEWIYVVTATDAQGEPSAWSWEKIGTTATDLDEYAKTANVTTAIATAKSEAISAAATDATTKADAALASAKTYADQAEADAISTAATALATAKTELEGKIATAKSEAIASAKDYTDGQIATVTGNATALATRVSTLEGKVDVDKVSEAIATAKSEAITAAAEDAATKADAALAEAKAYTDERETAITTAITTAYEAYADQAEADAISTAAGDATTKANTAESNAKAYTDAEIGELDATVISTGVTGITLTQTDGIVATIAVTAGAVADGGDAAVTAGGVKTYVDAAAAKATTKVQAATTTATADVTAETNEDESTTYTIDTLSDVTLGTITGATTVEGNKINGADKYVDWSRVTNATNAFSGSTETLTAFHADLDRLTNGSGMFSGCTNLTSFCGNLGSLIDGTNMFAGCRLDLESVIYIVDSLPAHDDEETHTITIGVDSSLAESDEIAALTAELSTKGWSGSVKA